MELLLDPFDVPEDFGADGVGCVAIVAPAYEVAAMGVAAFLERVDVNAELMRSFRGWEPNGRECS